jgi:hypothetical protein
MLAKRLGEGTAERTSGTDSPAPQSSEPSAPPPDSAAPAYAQAAPIGRRIDTGERPRSRIVASAASPGASASRTVARKDRTGLPPGKRKTKSKRRRNE